MPVSCRFRVCVVLAVGLGLAATPAMAMYMRPQLEQVPIERIVENLTRQTIAKPQDAAIWFNLARAHGMAYASKSETAEVNKDKPDQGVFFGFEPNHVPFQNKSTDDAEKQKVAMAHLAKALEAYQQSLKLKANQPSAQLGYAWCLDQSGNKQEAISQYRKTIADGWQSERNLRAAPLGWHSVVVEASGYLRPLLDKDKDQAELADLDAKATQLERIPRPMTPLAIPLADRLTARDIENRAAQVRFDADGSGRAKDWSWINDNAAWLVYDQKGTGQVESALQMFGSVTFWCFWDSGYQALASLDDDDDGQLTDAELTHLALWHDANGNGISETGEVRPLAAYDIVALSCKHGVDRAHPDQIVYSAAGVTYKNGNTRPTYDIVLHPAQPSTAFRPPMAESGEADSSAVPEQLP